MGWVRNVSKLLIEKPELAGILGAAATSPISIDAILSIGKKEYTLTNVLLTSILAASPFIAYHLGKNIAAGFHVKKYNTRKTQPGDRLLARQAKEELENQTPPTIAFQGEQKISLNPLLFLAKYVQQNPQKTEELAYKTRNPEIGIEAALRHFSKHNYDQGLSCLRDALDWMEGRKPQPSIGSRLNLIPANIALTINKKLNIRHLENYFFSAAFTSILQPEQAWHHSELGRKISDKLNLEMKTEMYVFHALLATAQKRTDEEQAWTEAITLLQEAGQPERVGESRNPVWMLKNTEFFEQTFRFKGKKTREALEKEWKDILKLEEVLQGIATVPQPLYITKQPNNGLYTLAMRFLPGEPLYDQLEKGDKSNLQRTIPIDARIIARYPAEQLPRISIAKKHQDKLTSKYLGLPEDLARNILAHLKPVEAALENDPNSKVNADRHPQQTLISEKIGVLDAEFENRHPAINEAANKLEYIGEFTNEERKYYITKFAEALRQEGASMNNPELAHAYEDNLFGMYDNAAIHRLICLLTAISDPERPKMHKHRKRMANSIVRAINDHKKDNKTYYEANKKDYDELEKSFTKAAELIPT